MQFQMELNSSIFSLLRSIEFVETLRKMRQNCTKCDNVWLDPKVALTISVMLRLRRDLEETPTVSICSICLHPVGKQYKSLIQSINGGQETVIEQLSKLGWRKINKLDYSYKLVKLIHRKFKFILGVKKPTQIHQLLLMEWQQLLADLKQNRRNLKISRSNLLQSVGPKTQEENLAQFIKNQSDSEESQKQWKNQIFDLKGFDGHQEKPHPKAQHLQKIISIPEQVVRISRSRQQCKTDNQISKKRMLSNHNQNDIFVQNRIGEKIKSEILNINY